MKTNGIVIGDVHWGAVEVPRLEYELEEILYKFIDSLDKLDFIIIPGDWFDSKEYVNSNVVTAAITSIIKLHSLTERFNTDIFIIEGTRSHDQLQTNFIKMITDLFSIDRIHIFTSVTKINIKGVNMLILPEEYIMSQDDYYRDFFKDKYDFIFGHGIIDSVDFSSKSKSKQTLMDSPVFKVDELLSVANYAFFGHVHDMSEYGENNRFTYTGSFSRWKFGEERDKGFYYFEYEDGKISKRFIHNYLARKYTAKDVIIYNNMKIEDVDNYVSNIIDNAFNEEAVYKLRLDFDISPSLDEINKIRQFILTRFGGLDNIKLKFIADKHKIQRNKTEQEKQLSGTNNPLLDHIRSNAPLESKISKFIEQTTDKKWSPEIIASYLEK